MSSAQAFRLAIKEQFTTIGVVAATISCALALLSFSYTGWVTEDSYIVFRVVDNITSGLGPVWNPGERLQVFTSPLWTGLLAVFSFVFNSKPPITSLGVSLICTLIVMAAAVAVGGRRPGALLLALGCLYCSQSFVDYSTSGLENPLLHALVALVCLWLWLEARRGPFPALAGMSLLCALALCTRHDALFIAAPALATVAVRRRREMGFAQWALAIGAGLSPFIVWECFSLFYYGNLFPNTALAKLPVGYPKAELVRMGLVTIEASLVQDPVTVLCVVLTPPALLVMRSRLWLTSLLASAGTLAYITVVGGDFMLGRFLSTIFVFSCLVLLAGSDASFTTAPQIPRRPAAAGRVSMIFFTLLAASALLSVTGQFRNQRLATMYQPHPPAPYKNQVFNERASFSWAVGLRSLLQGRIQYPWLTEGEQFRNAYQGRKVLITKQNVGMFGYAAGQNIFILDLIALGNSFLSRLPACLAGGAGHFFRPLPAGYVDTLLEGRNRISDPFLAALFDDVVLAARAPLGSPGRLAAIWRLNSGHYRDPEALARYTKQPGGVKNVGFAQGNELVCPPADAYRTETLAFSAAGEPPWESKVFPR